jgi:hypothetical protein|tara:strand:+ start:454 stop:606 length:153 start_codon:yes stop_codon:yes gene_type:complete
MELVLKNGNTSHLFYYTVKASIFLRRIFCLLTGAVAPLGCGNLPLYEDRE